jgi:hypothetical protein
MDAKHRSVQLVAGLGLAVAGFLCLVALARLRSVGIGDGWVALDSLFIFALGSYMIVRAVKAWDWAAGRPDRRAEGVQWGKILLGSWMIYSPIKNYLDPAPNLFKPANSTQALGMNSASIAFTVVGAGLILAGIRAGFRQTIPSATDPPESSRSVRRPLGVTVIAALVFIAALTVLLLPGGVHYRGIGTLRGPWVLGLSIFYIVLGVGLLKRCEWARLTTIAVEVVGVGFLGVALLHGLLQLRPIFVVANLTRLPISAWIISYLLKPEIRVAFGRTEDTLPIIIRS